MRTLKDVYLTKETFEKDLNECLSIITGPTKEKPYYTCIHISEALEAREVNVYVEEL